MSARCPSELALEQHLADPARSKIAAHLDGCARCGARLEEMRRQGEEFARFVYPATVDAVTGPERRSWLRWVLLAAPVAAAAGVALVALRGPPADYSGVKGAGLSLSLFAAGPAGPSELADGAAVAPDASLRFRVRAARPCGLWILSVDEAGQVSRLFPGEGEQGAPVRGAATPPGGATLDGRAGLERFYAICSEAPLGFAEVSRAAARVPHDPAGLRASARLDGLPRGAMQASVLVEKRR